MTKAKPKHNPTPWKIEENIVGGKVFGGGLGSRPGRKEISIFGYGQFVARKLSRANAERIVACVNACSGLEDPTVVADMYELIHTLHLVCFNAIDPHEFPRIADKCLTIINRAKRKQ